MTQVRGDPSYRAEFGHRLSALVEQHLAISWAQLATSLGYSNSTTVLQARRGTTLLSAEKLALLGELMDHAGRRVSLDWLLTGRGVPLVTLDRGSRLIDLAELISRAPVHVQGKVMAYLEVEQAGSNSQRDRA